MALTSVSSIPGCAQGKAKQRRDHSQQERKLMKDMAGPALHTYWRDLFLGRSLGGLASFCRALI